VIGLDLQDRVLIKSANTYSQEDETMPRVLIYGEDGLTLKYTKERTDEILQKLGDKSNPDECTIFFRPSFGRAQYGEFDAIIISQEKAYLVEAKWDESGDLSGGLREDQIRRHKIIEWFGANWNGEVGEKWDEFADKHNPEFKQIFKFVTKSGKDESKYIPSSESRVGQNLQTILGVIGNRKVENVLLLFYKDTPPKAEQEGFTTVFIQYNQSLGLFTELA
jgi:hypothetical protein